MHQLESRDTGRRAIIPPGIDVVPAFTLTTLMLMHPTWTTFLIWIASCTIMGILYYKNYRPSAFWRYLMSLLAGKHRPSSLNRNRNIDYGR